MANAAAQQTPVTGNSDVSEWLKAFAVQRKGIEQGIRERLCSDDRTARLAEADAALPELESPDADQLQRIADLLEDKLREMLEVVLRNGDPDRGIRLPPDFDPGTDPESLRDQVSVDERLWLFKGGIQEILYRFRNQGEALILEERDRLLNALSSSVQKMANAIGKLNAHPVVVQALDAEETLRVEQTLEASRALAARYKTVLTSHEEGVTPLLEDNYYKLQGQFTAACAQLCLQLYGNVSNLHLRELLSLKAMDVLNILPCDAPPVSLTESERKHLERKRDLMLKRVMARAKKESWPTWPILQLYNYDQRFGRRPPKARHRQHDEGLSSADMPTDRSGNPLVGGW